MKEDKNKDNKQFKTLAAVFVTIMFVISAICLGKIIALFFIDKTPAEVFKGDDLYGAPTIVFLTCVGSILVYLTLLEQIDTNKKTFEKIDNQEKELRIDRKKNEDLATFDRNDKLLSFAFEEIELFVFITNDNIYKGINALQIFTASLQNGYNLKDLHNSDAILIDLKNLLVSLTFISEEFIGYDSLDNNLKRLSDLRYLSKTTRLNDILSQLEIILLAKTAHPFVNIIDNLKGLFECYRTNVDQIIHNFNTK